MRPVAVDRRTRSGTTGFVWLGVMILVLAACSSGGGNGKVTLAEKHASDAQ
jgi:hypothetical protein